MIILYYIIEDLFDVTTRLYLTLSHANSFTSLKIQQLISFITWEKYYNLIQSPNIPSSDSQNVIFSLFENPLHPEIRIASLFIFQKFYPKILRFEMWWFLNDFQIASWRKGPPPPIHGRLGYKRETGIERLQDGT